MITIMIHIIIKVRGAGATIVTKVDASMLLENSRQRNDLYPEQVISINGDSSGPLQIETSKRNGGGRSGCVKEMTGDSMFFPQTSGNP